MDLIKKRTTKFFNKLGIKKIPEIYCLAFAGTTKIKATYKNITYNKKKDLILELNE